MNRLRRLSLTAAACLMLAVCLLLPGCKKDTVMGKGFRFPLTAEPRQLDPQVASDSASATVIAALFEGLTRLDEQGQPVPGAAEWSVSPDGLTYTFTLLDSQWSDGQPVRAQDFVYGFQRTVDPATKSPLAEKAYGIVGARQIHQDGAPLSSLGVTAADDKTLVITLEAPDDGFLTRLAAVPFMPCREDFFTATGGRYGLEAEDLISNGPFALDVWNHSKSLLMIKNEGYHGAQGIYPSAVRYVIEEAENPLAALTAGTLDAAEIPPEDVAAAEEAGMRIVRLDDTTRMLWLNNNNAALSSAAVRRALRDAIEWDTLNQRIAAAGESRALGYAAGAAVTNGGETYRTEDNVMPGHTDAAAARAALQEGLAQAQLTAMPSLTVLCADDENSRAIALDVVQSWQKNLSLYFELKPVPEAQLRSALGTGNYTIAIADYTPSGMTAAAAFAGFAGVDERENYANFSSAQAQEQLAAANTRAGLEAMEAWLYAECPSVPLSAKARIFALPENVSGVVIHPFGGGEYGAAIDFRTAGKTDS